MSDKFQDRKLWLGGGLTIWSRWIVRSATMSV
jgi:hypothetical protein